MDLMLIPHNSSLSPSGCVLPFDKVTSRTFASLQSSCHHSCDMHKALQEATDRFRTRHCSLLLKRENRNVTVGPTEQNSEESVSAAGPQRSREHCKGKMLQHLNLHGKTTSSCGVVPVSHSRRSKSTFQPHY